MFYLTYIYYHLSFVYKICVIFFYSSTVPRKTWSSKRIARSFPKLRKRLDICLWVFAWWWWYLDCYYFFLWSLQHWDTNHMYTSIHHSDGIMRRIAVQLRYFLDRYCIKIRIRQHGYCVIRIALPLSSCWRNFCHCLHRKLSRWQFAMQPATEILWRRLDSSGLFH